MDSNLAIILPALIGLLGAVLAAWISRNGVSKQILLFVIAASGGFLGVINVPKKQHHVVTSRIIYPLDIRCIIRHNTFMDDKEKTTKKTTVYLPLEVDKQVRDRVKVTRRSYNSEIVWLLEQQLAKRDK